MNWNAFDLNLLRLFDAMLADPNTTRAGERLGLTQPSVSNGLGRLRHVLGDPLFVREGNRMVPTAYALAIGPQVRAALAALRTTLDRDAFDPKCSNRTFRLLGDDLCAAMLAPLLAGALAEEAPGMRLRLLPIDARSFEDQLAEPRIDLMFNRVGGPPHESIALLPIQQVELCVVARHDNPEILAAGIAEGEVLPLDLYCALPQIAFAPDDAAFGLEEICLAPLGRRRNIVLSVHDFLALAVIAAQSGLAGSLPVALARTLAPQLGLRIHHFPYDFPPVPVGLFWHRRNSADPEHRWLRERLVEHLSAALGTERASVAAALDA